MILFDYWLILVAIQLFLILVYRYLCRIEANRNTPKPPPTPAEVDAYTSHLEIELAALSNKNKQLRHENEQMMRMHYSTKEVNGILCDAVDDVLPMLTDLATVRQKIHPSLLTHAIERLQRCLMEVECVGK